MPPSRLASRTESATPLGRGPHLKSIPNLFLVICLPEKAALTTQSKHQAWNFQRHASYLARWQSWFIEMHFYGNLKL